MKGKGKGKSKAKGTNKSSAKQGEFAEANPKPSPKQPKKKRSSNFDDPLTAQLALLDLVKVNIIGDGNCLFRALSYALTRSQSSYSQLRALTNDHIRANVEFYTGFCADEDIHKYLDRLVRDCVYGGHLELVAAATIFNIGIYIHQEVRYSFDR